MAIYLLGSVTKDCRDPKYIPFGVVAIESGSVAVRSVSADQIPQEYRPDSDLGNMLLQRLDIVLSTRREQDCSKKFTKTFCFDLIECDDESAPLPKRADVLFKRDVLLHYPIDPNP